MPRKIGEAVHQGLHQTEENRGADAEQEHPKNLQPLCLSGVAPPAAHASFDTHVTNITDQTANETRCDTP